jgi:hypothetical protein
MLILQAVLWVLLGASGCRRDTEADRRLDKLNGLSSKGGHVVVRARVLLSDQLHYKATDFIDLSAKSDLILTMLLPAKTRDDLSGGYHEICQVQVAENEEATPTLFHIYWLGQGPPLYSIDGSSHRYVRMKMPPSELRRDQHTDESIALCEFIQAKIAGDDARQAGWEQDLRISNGLDPPD